jgi:hypothetical protein
MDLELTETQQLIQKSARDFATRVIAPQAHDIDEHERFPKEILKGLAELGLMGEKVFQSGPRCEKFTDPFIMRSGNQKVQSDWKREPTAAAWQNSSRSS